MRTMKRVNGPKRRGQTAKAQSDADLAEVVRATSRLLAQTPLLRRHINPFGRYHFDLARMRQDVGPLVELPSEPSASERIGP